MTPIEAKADKLQSIIIALRNTANMLESGQWVLEDNRLYPIEVIAHDKGHVAEMNIHLQFAAVRLHPPVKPK